MPFARTVFLTTLSRSEGDEAEKCLLQRMVDDQNTNFRLAVTQKLDSLIDVLTVDQASEALDIIYALLSDKNWRLRHAALWLLPALARQMSAGKGAGAFNAQFISKGSTTPVGASHADASVSEPFKQCASDNCALIRNDWVRVCKEIAEVLGSEWVKAHVQPTIDALVDVKNYQLKSVFLDAAAELGGHLGKEYTGDTVVKAAARMAEDKVPNLRQVVATSMGIVASRGYVDAAPIKAQIKPLLEKLAEDSDTDVKRAAEEALDSIPP